jgi:hypothetical protein
MKDARVVEVVLRESPLAARHDARARAARPRDGTRGSSSAMTA